MKTSHEAENKACLTLKTFGQEFCFAESLKALRLADRIANRRALLDSIAAVLPQRSAATRARMALKIAQRYLVFEQEMLVRTPFLRLATHLRDRTSQRDLLYYQLTEVDRVVGTVARQVIYPFFIERRIPAGLEPAEFRLINGGHLIETERTLTPAVVIACAERNWGFRSIATLRRALRILQQEEIIQPQRSTDRRYHPNEYGLRTHLPSLSVFAYGVYDEFIERSRKRKAPLADLQKSRFARTFVLFPYQIDELLRAARRHRLVDFAGPLPKGTVHFVLPSLPALVEDLLARGV